MPNIGIAHVAVDGSPVACMLQQAMPASQINVTFTTRMLSASVILVFLRGPVNVFVLASVSIEVSTYIGPWSTWRSRVPGSNNELSMLKLIFLQV